MKASVQYGDFKGTAAADVSDLLATYGGNDFSSVSKYLNLDEERFKLIGVSIFGTGEFGLELICVDKNKSTTENECIIKLFYNVENKKEILSILFKRLRIVLYERFDNKHSEIKEFENGYFSDFHEE